MKMYSVLLFVVLIGSTLSCKCARTSTLSEDFKTTPTIFIGRVIKKVPPPTTFDSIQYTLEVEESFKGTSVGANVLVRAFEQKATCGIGQISVGDHLQIWLSDNDTTNSCTRTTTDISKDRAELQQLARE